MVVWEEMSVWEGAWNKGLYHMALPSVVGIGRMALAGGDQCCRRVRSLCSAAESACKNGQSSLKSWSHSNILKVRRLGIVRGPYDVV